MSGVDTGLWGGMLSAMSVVVGFQLFLVQNWLSDSSAFEAKAKEKRKDGELIPAPGSEWRNDMVENIRLHRDSYPRETTFVMSLTVILFCALSVVVGVQLEGIPVIFTVTPGIVLLAASLVVTVVSWRQADKKMVELLGELIQGS